MSRLLSILMLAMMLGLGVLGTGASQAAQDCATATGEFNSVRAGGNLGEMLEAFSSLPDSDCSEQVLYCAGNALALAHLESGYSLADTGAELETIRSELARGKAYGAPWQLLVGLADLTFELAQAVKDGAVYTEAATYYQDAINTINEPPICTDDSGMPSTSEISSIHKRMTEALLLAPQFDVVRTRAGNCGGVFLQSIRGFEPTFRPLPINFEFDKAEFTPAGRKAADQLLTCLIEENPSRVLLSGHTDLKGTAEYNMNLSQRRLASVEEYLRNGGFSGQLVLQPKGESEPFEADDPGRYSETEIDQLNRRVTLRGTE